MKPLPFDQIRFIKSALKEEDFPSHIGDGGIPFPEIALVGRSNVGKSSLINHLFGHKYLAKVSSTPGKTQLLNFFTVDGRLSLVDLPGYGFAKAPHHVRQAWAKGIETYLEKREELDLILLLLDIRRTPTEEDMAFVEWAKFHQKPLLCIFTKSDKISPKQRHQSMQNALEKLGIEEASYMDFTIKKPSARRMLIQKINHHLSQEVACGTA